MTIEQILAERRDLVERLEAAGADVIEEAGEIDILELARLTATAVLAELAASAAARDGVFGSLDRDLEDIVEMLRTHDLTRGWE